MADLTASAPQTLTEVEEPVAQDEASAPGDGLLLDDDLLVEDVSIDGMCGVY